MKRFTFLVALLPTLALAQAQSNTSGGGGISANCPTCTLVDSTLTLSGAITSSNAVGLTVTSQATNNASARGFTFNTSNTLDTGGARYFSFTTNGADVMFMDTSNNLHVSGSVVASSTGTVQEKNSFMPAQHGGTIQAIESGISAATSNALAVTFATAFGAAPHCTCADNNATPAACGVSVAATTTGVTFKGATGATDNISWICIGNL